MTKTKVQKWKKLKKFKDWNLIFPALLILLFFLAGLSLGGTLNPNPIKEDHFICHDMADFNKTLSVIEKNCESTFIVKEYGSDNWSVFVNKCGNILGHNYCESLYIPLEKCIYNSGETP